MKNKLFRRITSGDIHFKELLKGSVFSFILRIFGTLFGFLVTLVTTKFYGLAVLGTVTILSNLLQFVSVLGKLGFDAASLRLISGFNSEGKRSEVKEVYIKSLVFVASLSFILALCLFFFSEQIAEWVYHKASLSIYIKWLAFLVIPMSLLLLHRESLRGLKKITSFSFLTTSSVGVFSLSILLLMIFIDPSPVVPVLAQNIAVALSFLLSIFLWFRHSNFFKVEASQETTLRKIYSLSIPLFFGSFLLLINTTASSFVLSIFRSEAEVGVFNVAQKIAAICNISIVAVNSIAAPKFAEMHNSGRKEELKTIIYTSSKMIFWSTFPVLIFILLFHRFILGFFEADLSEAVPTLLLLVGSQFINAISGSVGLILQMSGEQKTFRNIALYTSLVNMALNFLLIPIWGVIGAAIASGVAYCFWNLVASWAIKKKLGILTVYFPFRDK